MRLAEEGADIIAADLCEDVGTVPYAGASQEDLGETVNQVEALDRRIVGRKADVRDFEALKRAIDDGVTELGRLDIVSANAGILSFGSLAEMPEETWRTMIDTNLTGVWHTVKAAIPHLISGGRGGSVVLTSSVAGLKGMQNIGHYVSAKHGVVGLMRALALELGEYGIRVNTLNPTNVDTLMIRNEGMYRLFRPDLEAPGREEFEEGSRAMHVLPTPWVQPMDISSALVFLASDEARYITGVTLPVDAGAITK